MGEAKHRKVAGLGFKGPSKAERDDQRVRAKKAAREKWMAENPIKNDEYDENDELVYEEFWNDEMQKWERYLDEC